MSYKILPRQRSQRLLLVASFFNKCFHFGHQINLFPSLLRGSKVSLTDNIRLISTVRANPHPALFPLHDSIRLGRSQGLHLHLAVHPAWHRRAQDLELHLLRSRRLVRRLKGRSTHVNDDLGERWALGLARSTNLSMALAAENWGSAYLENKDREGPLELGRRGLSFGTMRWGLH